MSGKPGSFRIADYALRDSIPPLADRGGEVRTLSDPVACYAGSDCKLAVPA